jgi:hypothetical protein
VGHFQQNNMRKVWEGMSLMSGHKGKKGGKSDLGSADKEYADKLNSFYCRFDCHDFSQERGALREELRREAESGKEEGLSGIQVTEEDVRREFRNAHPRKAAGPDKLKPSLLKVCADQLAGIFCTLFNLSLSESIVPSIWKTSCIVPVPKKSPVTAMNDLRPVALTSAVMKVLERLVLRHLQVLVSDFLDPLQFAYRSKRNVEDAVLYVLNRMYSHLENANTCIRLMFFDFSSAFNTMQSHLLVQKLLRMNVDAQSVLWIFDYLSNRPQFVRMSCNVISDVLFTNTGAPQGTVLSPFLFSLYTAECRHKNDSCPIVKFADDTGLTGLITDDDDSHYRQEIDHFVEWCDSNYLELNVSKTKEMIVDFRKEQHALSDIKIKGEPVERVDSYKYLGIVLDSKLSWKENTDHIFKRVQSRMYCLRKLRSFNVQQELLQMFYSSIVCSMMTFGLACWGGNVTKQDRNRLDKQIKKAGGVVGRKQDDIETMYGRLVTKKLTAIWNDDTHPLRPEFDSRLNDRSGRIRVPRTRTNRYRQSFIPTAIQTHNQLTNRSNT